MKSSSGLSIFSRETSLSSVREIFYRPYQLGAKSDISWSGILFRFVFSDGFTGYSDYTPLSAYGDPSLVPPLRLSAELFQQSLAWARVDAEARNCKISLWESSLAQENHYLCRDIDLLSQDFLRSIHAQGFSIIKIKMQNPGVELAERLNQVALKARPEINYSGEDFLAKAPPNRSANVFKFRLDFNSSSNLENFKLFYAALSAETRAQIEFIEDPFPFSQPEWKIANSLMPLAIDHELSSWDKETSGFFGYVIIKPAREDAGAIAKLCARMNLPFVVTSSLDHWLGVAMAAWVSGKLKKQYPKLSRPGGCLTFPDSGEWIWKKYLRRRGNTLESVAGTGMGFNEALENVDWIAGEVHLSEIGNYELRPYIETPPISLISSKSNLGSIAQHSANSLLLLNPRAPSQENEELQRLATHFARQGGVWIASSGSSQTPGESLKLIHLPMPALEATADAMNKYLHVSADDIWLQGLPSFHVGGFAVGVRARLAGFKVLPVLESWSAANFWRICTDERVTLTSLVPTQIYDLVSLAQRAPANLRAVLVGGAAMPTHLYAKAWSLGYRLYPSYGMTETGSAMATVTFSEQPVKNDIFAYSSLEHMQVRIEDDEILRIKGQGIAEGFAQIKNGKFLWQNLTDELGYFTSTDLARQDGSTFTLLGRNSDYVKILGEGVSLAKIQALLESWAPGRSAVFSVGDERKGCSLILAIEESLMETEQSLLIAEINKKLFPYERPSKIIKIPKIPRSPLGKILREKLVQAMIKADEINSFFPGDLALTANLNIRT